MGLRKNKGRDMKKQQTKEKLNATLIEFEVPTKIEKIEMLPNGTFKMIVEEKEQTTENVSSQVMYLQENGKHKIVNQVKQDANVIITNELQNLRKFDAIFAVDTNTDTIKGKALSVSSRFCAKIFKNETEFAITEPFSWQPVYIACENPKDAEKAGIAVLINHILEQNFDKNLKIAIITDHDLINLNEYNNKKKPIYDNIYLPDNMTLIYANAERGTEDFIINKLISLCEKEAKKCLIKAKQGQGIPPFIQEKLNSK